MVKVCWGCCGEIVIARVNQAIIISPGFCGKRVVIGGCGCVLPFCETHDMIPLDLLRLEVNTIEAESVKGVRVSITGVVCVKISAWKIASEKMDRGDDDDKEKIKVDATQVIMAAQHFLGKDRDVIKTTLTRVLEGHQRQIIGTMNVEELYKNRAEFTRRVMDITVPDLRRIGFELVSYTVTSISDGEGYLGCLGTTQLAIVKREAQVGKSFEQSMATMSIKENESTARQKVAHEMKVAEIAEYRSQAEAYAVRAEQENVKNNAEREVQIKRAQIDAEVARERAIADQSGIIEQESQQKIVVVKIAEQEEEKTRIEVRIKEEEAKKKLMIARGEVGVAEIYAQKAVIEAEGKVKVAEQRAKMVEAEATGQANAQLLVAEKEAEAHLATANGQAQAALVIGEAQANSTRMRGEAEAAALSAKLTAQTNAVVRKYQEMGQTGVLSELFPHLPDIAAAIAAPLSQTDKMTFISSDGSSSTKITNEVCAMLAQVPEAVESISGVDIKGAMKKLNVGEGDNFDDLVAEAVEGKSSKV